MIWLVLLLILVLLAIMPIGISARYGSNGAVIQLIAGFLHIQLYPRKTVKSKRLRATGQGQNSSKEKTKQTNEPGSVSGFLSWLNVILDILKDLRKKIRVTKLEMLLVLGGDDPCDLGIRYGGAWAALGNLIPLLESAFVIENRDLQIASDYTSTETRIDVRIDISISFSGFLFLATRHGIRLLRSYFKQNKNKGGVTT